MTAQQVISQRGTPEILEAIEKFQNLSKRTHYRDPRKEVYDQALMSLYSEMAKRQAS